MQISIGDAATHLNISIDTLRRWEKRGLIKTHRDHAGRRQFQLEDIKQLKEKHEGKNTKNQYRILHKPPCKLTALDLFAGAGGTALGLENAGITHHGIYELDKHACQTLKQNKPEWPIHQGDIHETDFTKHAGKIDLIEGGFPCQAFSYAGKKRGFADTRGTLFHEFARAIKEVQPRAAIGENVRGLATHDNGKTLKTMIKTLKQLGYRVGHKILRSQYLDVPQKRERLIIIALREDQNSPLLLPRERNYTISLREAIADVPEGPGTHYAPWKANILAQVPAGGYWRDLPEPLQRSYMKASYHLGGGKTGIARRLHWAEPALTLTCNPAQKQTERCHPEHTRPLNIREYARIQTFPDTWQFSGGIGNQYKQIGNAVPVNLGYHLGTAIRAMLLNENQHQFDKIKEQ